LQLQQALTWSLLKRQKCSLQSKTRILGAPEGITPAQKLRRQMEVQPSG